MLIEEIKEIVSNKKELRKFGYTIGFVLLLLGSVFFFYEQYSSPYFIVFGIIFILAGLCCPILLKPFHKVWMSLAVILGFIMTRLILSLLFYFVFTSIRLTARIFRKNFLELNINKETDSYWEKRDHNEYKPIDTERQF